MPVLTRSKRKLLSVGIDPSVDDIRPVMLKDITKSKRKKYNSKLEMQAISQQNTIIIQLEDASAAAAAAVSQKSNVAKRQESVIDFTQNLTQQQSQSQNEEDAGITMMRKIKKMLEIHFKNVAERLQFDPVPSCLLDLRNCHANHSKSSVVKMATNMQRNTAMGYLRAERLFQLVNYIRHSMCSQRLFPGADVLVKILEKMMKLAPSTTADNLSPSFILTEFHSLFMTILNLFPPCHIREHYLWILKSPFKIEGIPEKNQLLPSILEQLNDLIFLNEANHKKSLVKNDAYNFFAWDQLTKENVDFKKLSRNDRFERIFLILDIIVRLLEHDASIFIIKYSHKFASSIAKDKVKPLICSVIWQDFESVITINATIKQLISIFVAMVALQYPTEKIQIVSRLLTLISNVINMYEYPDDTFEYPVYKNFSIDFAREIQRTVENSKYNNLNLHHSVTENIRSPLTRMLLASFLLSKITNQTIKPSLSVPFNSIRSHEDFSDKPTARHARGTEQYPIHDGKMKAKQCRIVQSDYLRLLLIYAEALNSYYRISSALAEVKKAEITPSSSTVKDIKPVEEAFDSKKFKKSIKHVDLNEEVCLRKIDLNFKKMVHIRLTKEACSFYRDEIKNLLLLIKLIKYYHQKYGAKFDDWMRFIQKLEAEN